MHAANITTAIVLICTETSSCQKQERAPWGARLPYTFQPLERIADADGNVCRVRAHGDGRRAVVVGGRDIVLQQRADRIDERLPVEAIAHPEGPELRAQAGGAAGARRQLAGTFACV